MPKFHFDFHLLFLILFARLREGEAENQYDCTVSTCKKHGPAVRFPFWLKDRQPDRCGYPGFELSCDDKQQTVLELPISVKLLVKKIDYKSQVIHVQEPERCLPRRLPNLNISSSPFQFDQTYMFDFALFNCSARDRALPGFIPCLSFSGYQIYAITSVEYPITSCTKIRNVSSVPYYILVYQSNNFQLNWLKPDCRDCEGEYNICSLKNHTAEPEIECLDLPKTKGEPTKLVVTGVILGLFLLLVLVMTTFWVYSSNKKEKADNLNVEKFLEDYRALRPTRYSYAEIRKITNQFKDKLGQGGFGSVFKGKISNEIFVAVKVLNNSKGDGADFINEVGTIGRTHHVNVVRLVGFCADGFRRALVYEFLPNDSLQKFIFSENHKNQFLGWEKLQDIALGIAKGIEYLHQGCVQRILHFDIKPHNILLDHNLNPKISDFGLAKLCSKDKSVVSMTAARGTIGYIAPEVFLRNFGNVSHKSDVYSFGMLLLEIIGLRKSIDVTIQNTSDTYFPDWIYNHLRQGEDLWVSIEEEEHAKIAKKLMIVGLWCIQWKPVDRPSMKAVVQMLERNGDNLTVPANP